MLFADDNQVYKDTHSARVQQTTNVTQDRFSSDIKSWVALNKLQLNDSQTKAMLVRSNRVSVSSPLPSVFYLGSSVTPLSGRVKNLGATLYCNRSGVLRMQK